MALFDFRTKRVNDLNSFMSDPDRVYGTKPQQEYARKMSEELLKRKPENIRHWTQGVAYLLDTLAGIRYQNIAGENVYKDANAGGDAASPTAPGTPPTASVPMPAEEPGNGRTVTVIPPEVRAKLDALAPEKAEQTPPPVEPPKEITTGDILKGVNGTPNMEVPTPIKVKRNPFDLSKPTAVTPSAATPEGWTPTITPFIDEKAPYMSRKRDMSKVNSIVFHHDTSWNDKMSDVENAQRLAKYGQRVDKVRGFDPGYHYYISRDGSIIQGAPDDRSTNHVLTGKNGVGNNNALGIVLMGNDSDKTKPTEAQLKAAKFLGDKLMKDYKIPSERIYGHGEVNPGHRSSAEGMPAVNMFRNKIAETAPAEAVPETPMGLGAPRAETAPPTGAIPSEPDLVRMAQARVGTPDIPPIPYGPQPSVAQTPIPPVPSMTREDVNRLNRLNPDNAAEHEKLYRESLKPEKRDLTTPHQMISPARPGMPAQFQTNMPVQGPTITAPGGASAPLQYRIDKNGQGGYVPGIGNIPNLFDENKFGSPPSGATPADPFAALGDFNNKLSTVGTEASNIAAQGKHGQELANTYIQRGANAQSRIRDLDAVQAINNKYGDLLPSGPYHQWETSAKQVVGRVLGMTDKEMSVIGAGELKEKMLAKMITLEDDALGSRGTNLRMSMIERANPNMATSIKGSNLIAQVVKEQSKIDERFARYLENAPPSARSNIVNTRNEFMKEHPLKVKLGGDDVYIGNFDDMSLQQLRKYVPKGAYVADPNGKLIKMR